MHTPIYPKFKENRTANVGIDQFFAPENHVSVEFQLKTAITSSADTGIAADNTIITCLWRSNSNNI
jgi:hypothetical protein